MKRILFSLALASTAALVFLPATASCQNAALMPLPRISFLDGNGAPVAGGYLRTCTAGTACSALHPWSTPSNPLASYTDSSAAVPAANPIVLDSAGSASVWLGAGTYKVVLTDADGVTIWTQDNVSSTSMKSITATSGNAANFTYTAPGTGAVARTVATKLAESISVKDFGAVGDGVANDSVAIQKAVTACTDGNTLRFPRGNYLYDGIIVTHACALVFEGGIHTKATSAGRMWDIRTSNVSMVDPYTFSGSGGVIFRYNGNTALQIIGCSQLLTPGPGQGSTCSYLRFEGLTVSHTAPNHASVSIYVEDPISVIVKNFNHGDTASGAALPNQTTGIFFNAIQGTIPPQGLSQIENVTITGEDGYRGTSSYGIRLLGTALHPIQNVHITGVGDIENQYHEVSLVNAQNVAMDGAYFLGSPNIGIEMISANNITLGGSWQITGANNVGGMNFNIDAASLTNFLSGFTLSNPTTLGTNNSLSTVLIAPQPFLVDFASFAVKTKTLSSTSETFGPMTTTGAHTFLSGAAGTLQLVNFGRTATEVNVGTVASNNQFFVGTVAGDFAINNLAGDLFFGAVSGTAQANLRLTQAGDTLAHGAVKAITGFYNNGSAGGSQVVNVRNSTNTAACTITYSGGLFISTTCP